MKESLPKIDSSCNDTFRRISKVPTMPVLSRFTYTAYVLADSLFFSSTPGASSSRGRLQVGGVCKSGASARASSRRERLQVGNAFKSGASLRRHEQFNAACFQTPRKLSSPQRLHVLLADSLFFSSTPGASSSRERHHAGGVFTSGAQNLQGANNVSA